MSIEVTLDLQTLVIFGGIIIGITWFFTRCETQHRIKHEIGWWIEHDLNRFLVKRIEACERFNARTSKKQWYLILVGGISLVYLPVMAWGYFLPIEERASDLSRIAFVASYIGTIAWMGFLTFRKKKCKVKVDEKK